MRLPIVVALAAGFLLAGCTAVPGSQPVDLERTPADLPDEASPSPAPASEVHLRGHVLTPALAPIEGASISVVAMDLARVTGADGAFDFGMQASRLYTLQASAAGYESLNLTVSPAEAASPIKVVLEPGAPVTPYTTTVSFRGILECAFEALIISPSCDSGLTAIPGAPRLFRENQSFLFGADLGWKTLVLDLVFDGEAHPGLDGLRTAVRGTLDADGGGEYLQYGRWHNPTSFTVRIEPGGNYTDGTEPVPANATGFQVDVYPHGHAYHEVCAESSCFLGAG
ncbi:MAG TPA: carboxypeptidase-like regulatory domain-containing protein, partial [Candidatus Thermoplasmatota archaeon]|nr:carboxypeptidase-like regulatory domain-containing protein [Candidatus Thermoplasmatota archaeon]